MLLTFRKSLKYLRLSLMSSAFSLFLLLNLFSVSVRVTLASDEKSFKIAMITWRGETDAEQGFVEGLRKSIFKVSFH